MAGWMRLYTEIRHDRKIRRLPPSLRWLWVVIMTIAKDSPQPGWLKLSCNVSVTVDDLVDEAAIPIQEVELGIKVFTEQEMIELVDGVYHLVNWDKRQYVSDSSIERVRKHRSKPKDNTDSSIKDVTLQERYRNGDVTPPEYRVQSTDIKDHHDDDNAPARKEQNNQNIPGAPNLFTVFEKEFGRPLSPFEFEQIQQWEKDHGKLLILEALKRAIMRGKHNFKYINSILVEWHKNNLKTIQAVEAYDVEFQARRGGQAKPRGDPQQRLPKGYQSILDA